MYRDGRKVDILFLIEHCDRELDVVCAISKELKLKYGLSVAIASLIFHSLIAALFIRPKVIVVPFCYRESNFPFFLFRAIYGNTITYVDLNLEQILSPVNEEYKKPRDEFIKLRLKHFCWGESFKRFLIENGVTEENIYKTGNPATSLLVNKIYANRDSLKNLIAERFNLPRNHKWFFFPINCGWGFMNDYQLNSRIKEGYDKERAIVYRDYVSETLNIFFSWINKARNELKNQNIIIILRPHPSVSVEQYKERFKEIVGYVPDYVYLHKDLTAKEWLVVSDACYTNFSTVALDAGLIGKPTFLLEPKPYPSFIETDWNKAYPKLKTFEEFKDSLKNYSSNDIKPPSLLNNYVDLSLNGIDESAKYLAKFAEEKKIVKHSIPGLFKGIIVNPRQALGSFLRMIAMTSGFNPFDFVVKKGLQPDFFRKRDIVKLIKNQS